MSSSSNRPPTSGANIEELPLPPPDYTPISTEQWSKQRMPPMRGIIVDPEYPPTEAEARKAMGLDKNGNKTPKSQPTKASSDDGDKPFNARRGSGTSQIFSAAPTSSEIINEMPGGTAHTAGGEQLRDVGVAEAVRTIRPRDFLQVHRMPCFRDSYLYGISGGFLVGGSMWIVGKPIRKIPNYVVGTTIGVAMVAYAWCHSERQKEKRGMRMVVDVMEQKKVEKKVKIDEFMEKKRREESQKKVEEQKIKEYNSKNWWRFWEGREGGSGPRSRGREG